MVVLGEMRSEMQKMKMMGGKTARRLNRNGPFTWNGPGKCAEKLQIAKKKRRNENNVRMKGNLSD